MIRYTTEVVLLVSLADLKKKKEKERKNVEDTH